MHASTCLCNVLAIVSWGREPGLLAGFATTLAPPASHLSLSFRVLGHEPADPAVAGELSDPHGVGVLRRTTYVRGG